MMLGALSPLTYAVAPMRGAYSVFRTATLLDKIYALSDKKYASAYTHYHLGDYPCTCGQHCDLNCDEITEYFVANMEQKTVRAAANATVVGAPFEAMYSLGRNLYKWSTGTKGQVRARYAKALWSNARPVFKRGVSLGRRASCVKNHRGEVLEITRSGCRRAQAMLAIILGELELDKPAQALEHYSTTLPTLVNPMGYKRIYDAFNKR